MSDAQRGTADTARQIRASFDGYLIGSALLAISAAVRLFAYPIVVSDYTYFLAKWFDALAAAPGLTAFAAPFSDYAPLYLYLLKLLTFIPVSSLYSIKTLSLAFEIGTAVIAYLLLKRTTSYAPGQIFLMSAIILATPTLLINSSLWGQSDAAYAAGIVLCFYLILRDRPLGAALAFAFAFCLKVQSVFFLPVLIGYCLLRKERLAYLLLIPLAYALSVVPAWLSGGSLLDLLTVYAHQAGEYTGLSVSAQSAFAYANALPLSASVQGALFWAGIIAAGIAALAIILGIARSKGAVSVRHMALLSLLAVTVIPYLLPRMHERYFYLADVFSLIYAFYSPKEWYVPVAVVLSSFLAYMPFLSGQVAWFSLMHVDLRIPATILLAVIAWMLLKIVLRSRALTPAAVS